MGDCALGPKYCTAAVCECQRLGMYDIRVVRRGVKQPFTAIIGGRQDGKTRVAKMGAWKGQWKQCAWRAAVAKSGACIAAKCDCPNCMEHRELTGRASALQDEYVAAGQPLSWSESFLRASPIAYAAATSSPYAAPLDTHTRVEDYPDEFVTTVRKELDRTPIRWQAERVFFNGGTIHDGTRRDQGSERKPQAVAL